MEIGNVRGGEGGGWRSEEEGKVGGRGGLGVGKVGVGEGRSGKEGKGVLV